MVGWTRAVEGAVYEVSRTDPDNRQKTVELSGGKEAKVGGGLGAE